jgi:hypothetical protein
VVRQADFTRIDVHAVALGHDLRFGIASVTVDGKPGGCIDKCSIRRVFHADKIRGDHLKTSVADDRRRAQWFGLRTQN